MYILRVKYWFSVFILLYKQPMYSSVHDHNHNHVGVDLIDRNEDLICLHHHNIRMAVQVMDTWYKNNLFKKPVV